MRRMMIGALVALGLVVAPLSVAGQSAEELYKTKCSKCHGDQGEGNEKLAKMMKVEIKPLDHPDVQAKSDEQLRADILEGVGKMKATKGLTKEQADEIVELMRKWAEGSE